MRRDMSIGMLVVAVGLSWRITFNVHADNVAVVVMTECKGKEPFYAYDRYNLVDAGVDEVVMRRQLTPKSSRCTVQASIMRAVDEDPRREYVGESVIVIQQD